MVPSRAAWRSLLWSAPLTALWVLLTYRWPAIPSSGIPTTTHQLAGRHQGAALDDLDVPTLITLLSEIDEDSIPLLAAYLDRRQPRWREHAPDDAAAANGSRPSRAGKMTEEEAYQILGIQAGATAQDIARAHRSLMKKLHPDQGGSTYLAALINEAEDVLIRDRR